MKLVSYILSSLYNSFLVDGKFCLTSIGGERGKRKKGRKEVRKGYREKEGKKEEGRERLMKGKGWKGQAERKQREGEKEGWGGRTPRREHPVESCL